MTEQKLRAKALQVYDMSEIELLEFGNEVSTSLLDGKSKMYLYEAIETRQSKLDEARYLEDANVVSSDIDFGDFYEILN